MSPASQGIILPIKSHEVHQETCRTVPFSQVFVLGGGGVQMFRRGGQPGWVKSRGDEMCQESESHLISDLRVPGPSSLRFGKVCFHIPKVSFQPCKCCKYGMMVLLMLEIIHIDHTGFYLFVCFICFYTGVVYLEK